ncbi:MAG TPA: LuxR C-terminal-related transcriptional regulator [Candidatus Aquirickettsiella sp.]|jgi:DNA-binding NarL/FixJ family response regulator
MPKSRTVKAENLLKKINDAEVQLSELLARYHLSFIGNNNPSSKVLEHTIQLLSHIFVKASIVLTASLTTREKEYIELASRGYKLKEIAKFLNIALSTAKSVREVILQKLFCRNITEATAVARKYQLLP